MSKNWSYIRDEWLKSTTIAEDDAKWALEALINTEEDLFEIENVGAYCIPLSWEIIYKKPKIL